ncbi:MAG: hypothetical protein KME30_17700 [Iphinoe sp. HA4291-MV1]|jgi:hypothetical protein|nr:hypothetical protein [Iphinoe sp. HA4291-MV1]
MNQPKLPNTNSQPTPEPNILQQADGSTLNGGMQIAMDQRYPWVKEN